MARIRIEWHVLTMNKRVKAICPFIFILCYSQLFKSTIMKLYKLECLNEDGDIETNGYYLNKDNAELAKVEMDGDRMNTKYGIKQYIVEIETED